MISQNLLQFAEANWEEYKTTVGIASKNQDGVSLVEDDLVIYNFDKLCESIFSKKNPKSADGVCFSDGIIQLVEFKSGFKQKITKKNFDIEKAKCDVRKEVCDRFWKLFWENQEKKIDVLLLDIKLKAIESYVVLEKHIFPRCEEIQSGKKLKLIFTAVIDEDGVDGIEDTLAELSGKEPETNNSLIKLRQSLRRLSNIKDSNGNAYYYDQIEVLTAKDYQNRINISK